MIGLARSGKSTVSKRWSNHEISFTEDGTIVHNRPIIVEEPRVVVNGDSWRLAMGHRYNAWVEPLVHAQVEIAVRALLLNHNVLVDETNTNPNSITKWLEADIDAIPIFINTPVEVCKKRAIDTNQPDLVPVIERMNINLIKTFGPKLDIMGVVSKLRDDARIRNSFKRIVD
jgi:hypothetical protein